MYDTMFFFEVVKSFDNLKETERMCFVVFLVFFFYKRHHKLGCTVINDSYSLENIRLKSLITGLTPLVWSL